MRRASYFQCVLLPVIAMSLSLSAPASDTGPTSEPVSGSYRIVRIVIPTDSPYRKSSDLNHPPNLYVCLRKNGEKIGKESETVKGWEVEFADHERNRYRIDADDNVSYVVEVWDHNSVESDQQVLTITGLHAADFDKPILERIANIDPPERAVHVEFQRVSE